MLIRLFIVVLLIVSACPCAPGCRTCQTTDQGQKCFQCYDDFNNNQGHCECDSQQYIKNQTNCEDCQVPIKYCVNCTTSSSCQQCEIGSHRSFTVNKRCECDQGYFDKDVITCQSCSVITGCRACISDRYCISCEEDTFRILNSSTHLCDCKPRYFQFQYICYFCQMNDCLQCNSTDFCLFCDPQSHKASIEGQCRCVERYF